VKFELDASHSIYIKMRVTGIVDKPGLISAISELMQHPEYLDKHSFWDFTQANLGLSISDLNEIVGILRLYKPRQKEFANRSSILVTGPMTSAIVDMFVKMTALLPFNYRVFNDAKEAEAFLNQ